jgi:hypothetical protein
MTTQISFHKIETNRWYSGGRWKQDNNRPDSEVVFLTNGIAPLCGWDWYKAHYNAEIPEQSIEISFDNKILATITDWGYKKGMSKAIIDAEIAKHPSDFYKHKGKWNWLYIADKTEQKQTDITLYGREFNNPIIAQCTAIIEDMTFADITVCVG